MYKYAELQLVPFNNRLYVYIGRHADINKITLVKFKYNLSKYAFDASGIFVTIKKDYMIWCCNKNSLLHEVSHCVDHLMKHYSVFNSEFRAYYTEYLYKYLKMESNYKIIGEKKVKK